MTDARWRGEEHSRACAQGLVADRQLELTFEDVERIGVVFVGVGLDRPEPGLAPELEDLGLVPLVPDADFTPTTRKLLALAGA